MDSFQSSSEQCSSNSNSMSSTITAEETAMHSPASLMVIPGTMVVNPTVVPANTFHHLQDNFVGLAEKLTNQASTPTDPFRRLHDSAVGDVPVINHIGVFVKGDGEEEMHSKDLNGKLPSEFGSDQYQSGSPVVPLPECGHQVLVGGEGEECHTPYNPSVSYSQECTEDVDSSCSYQLGKHWEKGDLIGRGISGTCYVGIDWVTRSRMVVKQISKDASREDVMSEVDVMQDIRHENIVQFYGATRDHRHVNLFMELMEGSSVEDRLRYGAFEEDTICHYLRQLVSGVHYLHRKGIVHRDLKGGNLLTDITGEILKIADFGAAARLVDSHKFYRSAGTVPYMAPEVVRAKEGRAYGAKCDVWSIGCVVIEMATTRPPWILENHSNHKWEIFFRIGKSVAPPSIPSFCKEDLRDFTIQCLRLNPEDRPSSENLMNLRLMT